MKRLAIALALVVAGVIAGAGPASAGETDVAVAGDSLTAQSQGDIETTLRSLGWTPHVVGASGSGLTFGAMSYQPWEWTTAMADLEARFDPEVVVIELGTNDAIPVNTGEPYPPHIARLLAVTDARRVIWLDCSQHTAVPERNAGCATIRTDLLAVERLGFEVADYDAEVASDETNICYDSVHLCPGPGTQAMADLIGRHVGPRPK